MKDKNEDAKFTEELDAFSSPEGKVETRTEGNEGNPDSGDEGGNEFKPSPMWDYVKTKLPEDKREEFKLPEDINAENEQEYIDKYLSDVYSSDSKMDLHPLADEIQRRVQADPNFNPAEWVKEQYRNVDINNISDKELIKERYLNEIGLKSDDNPDGITEEEIDSEIEKMNLLDRKAMAKKLREAKAQEIQSKYSTDGYKKLTEEELSKKIKEYKSQVDDFISKRFAEDRENPEDSRKFAGIDLGEAKYQEFKDVFKEMLIPNDNGVIPIRAKLEEVLLDDNKLEEFAKYLHFKDEIGKAVTKARNEGKLIALDLLDDTERKPAGSQRDTAGFSDDEELNRLSAPEGSYR